MFGNITLEQAYIEYEKDLEVRKLLQDDEYRRDSN
jgi:hypothetical protein